MTDHTIRQGLVYYRDRLLIPRTSTWVSRLFIEAHGGPIGGHEGTQKTYQRMARDFYWVGMRRDIAQMVAECDICQRHKYSNLSPAGLLQPLNLPKQLWEDLTMDFIDGLPKSDGYSVLLVVVDRLSKAAHFTPLKHPYTANSVATVFIREVVRLHGIPTSIISDRDKVFLSNFWKELFKFQGTVLKHSTAYHPQTDGQTEVVNRSLETYLRCFASTRPKEWVRWLPWAEYWYNTSFHSTIGTTPFKILYGRDPPRMIRYDQGAATTFDVDKYLLERDRVLEELREQFMRAQQLMKAQADGKRRDISFSIGDKVYLKLRPYRQITVAKRAAHKLAPRFYGPFEVVERIGQVAYRLRLPPTSMIHPVFHVSQLKRVIGNQQVQSNLPADLGTDGVVQPKKVLGTRELGAGREVLIAWDGLPDNEATWEDFEVLQQQFPTFHLEDKVVFRGGGNDTNKKWGRVYGRKTGGQVQGA